MKILCLIIIPKGNFLQKNDVREKERERGSSKEMRPSGPGRWGSPEGAGAPASLPVTSVVGRRGHRLREAQGGWDMQG